MKDMVRQLVCLVTVAGLGFGAAADVPPITAYAQRGLAAQWDGLVKAADETTTWTDLVGGLAFALTDGCEVKDDRVYFPNGATYGRTSSADALALFSKLGTKGTLEIFEHTTSGGKITALQGVGGVAIGSYGGVNLINCNAACNAREFDWAGTTNTIAVQYSSGKCGDAYANGRLLNVLSYTENFSGGSSSVTLGNRENLGNPFYGSIYAVRAYTNQLSAAEIGRNAAIDHMRYLGAGGDELGFRWNAETETGTSRIAVASPGIGQIRVNGAAVSSGAADWFDDGAVVTIAYVPDAKVSETGAWRNLPFDATVSDDGRTATFTACGPVTLVYAISEVETDDLVANDATMRRIETPEGVSYVFTNGSATVTLKDARTMVRALLVGGGGAGGGASGSGGAGGQVVPCGKRVIQAASVLTVVAGAGGAANGASAGSAGGASSLAVPGAAFSATGGAGGAAKGNAAGAGAGVESDITGVTRLYGAGGAAKGGEPAEPGADGLGAGGDGGATGAKGGAGTVILSLSSEIEVEQPEIVDGSVRISFDDGLTIPRGEVTLGGREGAVYSATVIIELGIEGQGFLSSNVVDFVTIGSTVTCFGDFLPQPGERVTIRVTVKADGAETRTSSDVAVATGTMPAWMVLPTGAYAQRGLLACWDGGENAGAGRHSKVATRWVDTKGGRGFDLSSAVGVELDRMTFASNSAWGDLSAADTSATFNKASTPLTVEVVETRNVTGDRNIAVQAPGGVNIGYFNGDLLANSGYANSYVMNWKGTNTIAVLYDGGKWPLSAWSNGAPLGYGSYKENTNGSGSLTTVGNRQSHQAAFGGSLYALRLYEVNLTSGELARNRAVDRIRFMGATQDEVGFRWNAATQSATLRVTAATAGAGQILVNDAAVVFGAANWFAEGETVTVAYVPDGIVTETGAWQNVPSDATVSDDGLTVTLTAVGPVDLVYAITQSETEDIATDDASMRRVVTDAGVSYIFTNGEASVTLKRDRLLASGLVATGGESVECNDIPLAEGTPLTVVAAPSGTSLLVLPGETYSASGDAGSVTLTLTDPVAGGQPEIVEGSVRITFPDGLAMPCGTMTLGGEPGAIYAAKVVVELGVNDGPALSSNVVEGAVMGNTINCDGHFFALPTDTVWLRVTVSAADAETRTANEVAASEGACPNCAYIPASAYVQRGLVACWDGGENAGLGHHLPETDRWTDLSGTYSFALTDTTVGLDGMIFALGSSIGIMSSADSQATFGKVKPGTAEVVEYTANNPSGSRSVVISSGMGPGVFIGQYGGNVLANVAREDSYAFNWRGTTNTVSVAYDANRHATGAWANAAPLGKGSNTDNTTVTSDGTVGNRTTKDAPFRGTVYCIRLYSAVLTDEELARNRAIDRVRFGQTPAAEAGLRWNRESGQLEGRVRCQTNGKGAFTFEGQASSDATAWQTIDGTVTAVYHPTEDDDEPVGWVNLPAGAVVSADGFSVTLPVKDATDISFAVAKTLRVTPDADDATGTGEAWDSPVSLPRALELAAGAGRILCKAGTYDITAPLVVRGTVSVEGGFAGTDDVTLAAEPVSVLDAQGRAAVADVMTVTSETGSGNVLKGLCFRGGYRHGLNKTGAAPIAVHGCRFEANGATAPESDVDMIYGRGLSCTGTGTETLTVSNCVFAGNVKTIIGGYAGYGFALGVRNLARVVVDDTLFITNGFNYAAPPRGQQLGKSGCGGTAIYALNAPITARRCRFVANHGMCYDEAVAGGIVRLAGAGGGSSFENCVWSGNEEPCGSGGNGAGAVLANGISGMLSVSFDTSGATCDVVGCTFAYNLSDAWFAPAAVHLLKGTMTLRNSLVFGNFTSTGCRVGRDVYVRAAGSLSVDHTLFGTNGADRIMAASGATLTLGEGVKYGDPLFVTPFADVQPLATISGGPGSNFRYDAATRAALTAFNVHLRGGSGYVDEATGGKVRAYRESKVGGSSPALNAGNPASDCSHEPLPNGHRVNLGFYGNTPWATMSKQGTALIVK